MCFYHFATQTKVWLKDLKKLMPYIMQYKCNALDIVTVCSVVSEHSSIANPQGPLASAVSLPYKTVCSENRARPVSYHSQRLYSNNFKGAQAWQDSKQIFNTDTKKGKSTMFKENIIKDRSIFYQSIEEVQSQ